MLFDQCVIGTGFFGSTAAEHIACAGRKVLVIDQRCHICGKCFSKIDPEMGIECNKYGSHIFHTLNKDVW